MYSIMLSFSLCSLSPIFLYLSLFVSVLFLAHIISPTPFFRAQDRPYSSVLLPRLNARFTRIRCFSPDRDTVDNNNRRVITDIETSIFLQRRDQCHGCLLNKSLRRSITDNRYYGIINDFILRAPLVAGATMLYRYRAVSRQHAPSRIEFLSVPSTARKRLGPLINHECR